MAQHNILKIAHTLQNIPNRDQQHVLNIIHRKVLKHVPKEVQQCVHLQVQGQRHITDQALRVEVQHTPDLLRVQEALTKDQLHHQGQVVAIKGQQHLQDQVVAIVVQVQVAHVATVVVVHAVPVVVVVREAVEKNN